MSKQVLITRDSEGADEFMIVFWAEGTPVQPQQTDGVTHWLAVGKSPLAQMHTSVFEALFGFLPDPKSKMTVQLQAADIAKITS